MVAPGPPAGTAAVVVESREPLLMSARSRRRIGAALIAYGVAGTLLAILVAGAGLYGAARLDDAVTRIEAERAELAATVAAAADALANVTATVDASRPAIDRVAGLTGQLTTVARDISTAAADLAGRMDVSVLGFQPFAGLGAQMSSIGGQVGGVADQLESVAPAVTGVADGTAAISASLVVLQARLDAISQRIDAVGPFDQTGRILVVGLIMVVLLDLWLAIPAVTAIAVGRRLRRG